MANVLTMTMSNQKKDDLPWYRYGWPWFLISIPMVSVVLGSTMLYLALNANNSMVVDDYYKQGKAINVRIERDRAASLLGLSATLESNSEGLLLQLQESPPVLSQSMQSKGSAAKANYMEPNQILVNWVHVTQANKDTQAEFVSLGGGRYLSTDSEFPKNGVFRAHIQPKGAASWRLISPATNVENEIEFTVGALPLEKVFLKIN